jgi:signal transduction histidine kinase
MRSWRMRTMLLLSLVALALTMTAVFLVMVRLTTQRQVRSDLALDMQHSLATFHNLRAQRQELLLRESSLISEQQLLKATMTSSDPRTISDSGEEFWRMSGNDFFALMNPEGKLDVYYNQSPALTRSRVEDALRESLNSPGSTRLFTTDGRLFEITSRSITFGSGDQMTGLGYVTIGYALDEKVAKEVSESAAAEVVFAVDGNIVAGTLPQATRQELSATKNELLHKPIESLEMRIGGERYLASSVQLQAATPLGGAVQLVVLKSFAEEQQILSRLNRLIAVLGFLAALLGVAFAALISRTVTRPLESLVIGTRALSRGDFTHEVSEEGAMEVRELSRAFDRMRRQMQKAQEELLAAERMATIGQMASSISHDLRHYLSAVYANAEFLANPRISSEEREELFADIRGGVQGMTEMLDSLLVFGRTGMQLRLRSESLASLVDRTATAVRSHPDARGVDLRVQPVLPLKVEVDERELRRALYNLLLNACQAIRGCEYPAWVTLETAINAEGLSITVRDTGPGIPKAIRNALFQPFVSEGKQSGVGLGLALCKRIAEAHGGSICLEDSVFGHTAFTIILPRESIVEESSRQAAERR